MTRREDRGSSVRRSWLSSQFSLIALAVAIGGAAIAIRSVVPPQELTAQTSPRRQASKARSKGTKAKAGQLPPPATSAAVNIAAVVNGEPITRQALGRLCLVRWGKETLESLVNKHLITEACQARGIVISESDIEAEIKSTSAKFGMSPDQYLSMLKKERDVSATQYRRDIIWPMLALKRLAADRLTVTQEQLDRAYESEFGPKVQVRMISLTSPSKAAEVHQRAKATPDDFSRLAKEYSEDPNSASAKGLIPPVRKHMGEPAIEQAVFALKPGDVSEVIHAANQYFVFRCERHIPAATISPQYRRQTMESLRDRIIEDNLRTASGGIFKSLQADAKIVNVFNDPTLRKQAPGVAAYVNKRPISIKQLMDECVVRYGREMVETEINHRLLTQELKRRKLTVSEQAINAEVARAAEAFGYIKKDGSGAADVDGWVAAVTEQEGIGRKEYIRDAVWPSVALKQLVGDKVAVTQEDLRKGFQANYGERVEVLAIVLGNQRVAQEVWDMARKNPSKEFFGQLAEQYSVESVSRANFGEIPPIRRHGGQPQIESEAFRLQPGELSGIVAMGDKFIILKCLGRTEPIVEELTEVQNELAKDIREKKLRLAMADEFDNIREAAQIDNFIAGTSQSGKTQGPRLNTGRVPARKVSTKPGSNATAPAKSRGRRVLLQPPGR